MGCASSKQTKVVKFQEPGSSPSKSKDGNKNPTAETLSSTAAPATKPAATSNDNTSTAKKNANDVTQQNNNNNNNAEQPELTPVVEIPKTEQEEPTKSTDTEKDKKDKKLEEYANSILAPTALPTSDVDSSKNKDGVDVEKKDAKPLSGGVWETRPSVIDATTSRIYSPTRMASIAFASKTLTILHFNDVYNIEPREQEPVGGAARFVTKIKSFSESEAMVLFSGDLLNPSLSKYQCFPKRVYNSSLLKRILNFLY